MHRNSDTMIACLEKTHLVGLLKYCDKLIAIKQNYFVIFNASCNPKLYKKLHLSALNHHQNSSNEYLSAPHIIAEILILKGFPLFFIS